jgi:hypothetical protein
VATELLKQAFEAAEALPADEQNALAAQWLEELRAERKRAESTERGAVRLRELGARALEEHQQGETSELDPESL